MTQVDTLEPVFVEEIPRHLEPGKLYVSMEFATAAHACCCGCGEEVMTPFAPTDWSMSFDGESVSLSPSIGNWYLQCRSHYIIRRGRVIQAAGWTQAQIDREWDRDRKAKASFYGTPETAANIAEAQPLKQASNEPSKRSWWSKWWRR